MAIVGRLAGAILAETEGRFFLVGNPKEPCDFLATGFKHPGQIDATKEPFIRLFPLQPVHVPEPYLSMNIEGEALARLLADRFLIRRNGSVSDRLWRLVSNSARAQHSPTSGVIDARWLGEIPAEIWHIVREAVLKCG